MTRFPWLSAVRRRSNASLGSRRTNSAARKSVRLQLESLEDRTLLSVHVLSNFKGMNTNTAGGVVEPPDPIVAAGPTAVVELVNSNIAYYDKTTGKTLFSEDLGTFFAPVDHVDSLLSDVSVSYDEQAGRFFVSTMDIDFFNVVSYFDFAVSNDSNPLDGFTEMHQINTTEVSPRTGETMFTDFPRLGWNADAYVVSFSMFGFYTEYQYNTQLLTIQKSTVLDKNNATLTYYQVDRPLPNSTVVPATMHGSTAGGPMWLVEEKGLEQNGSYAYLRVEKMTNLLSATPTFTDYYVPMASYTVTPFPGDTLGQVSTVLDTRILSLDWRNNQMVASQNVGISSDMDVHARWYVISTGGTAPSLVQQGTLAPGAGIDTYMPSAALATDGSIGMTYIESSLVENMSMYVTGRTVSDPAGTMEAPVLVQAGAQYYQGTRIGDFSGIAVDPVTGTTFWAVNEYAIATSDLTLPNWGTWIANLNITATGFVAPITPTLVNAVGPRPDAWHRNPNSSTPTAMTDDRMGRTRGHLLLAVPSGLADIEHRRDGKKHSPHGRHHEGRRSGGDSKSGHQPLIVNVTNPFAGMNTNTAGGVVEPPDPIVAAGPTAVVELVNSNIAYYDKTTGRTLFSEDLGTFFAPVDHVDSLLSDVSVSYDEQAGRFFVSTMDIDFFNVVSYFDFAVSNDSNPLDGFTEMHQINTTEVSPRTGETMFTDFPRLGWNADAYVVSFSMFGFYTQYQYNTQLLTIQKSTVLDKNNATLTYYQVDRPLPNSTVVPATMHGSTAGGPMWLVEEKGLEQNGSYAYLRVEKMTNILSATPTFTDYYVPMAAYTITPFPGDTLGQVSTVLDTRILSLDWRNNQIVASQNVGISSDMDVHARWYVISTGGTAPSLVQQGTLAPGAGIDTYMPSAALATDGSVGMTYIESSPVENMSMYVTGRTVSDPAGTMETSVLVKAGAQYYQGTRIGDFSGIAVDPVTGTTFWAVNEYAIATSDLTLPNWGTWLAAFQVVTPTFTWTGNGTTTNWSDPNNWAGGVAPSPGSNLVFGPSATKLISTDNFASGTPFGTITLSGGGYAISGNSIVLTGGLDGSGATGSNTFGLNIRLSAAETFQAGSGSTDLTLSGAINNGGFLLTIGGGNGLLGFPNTISGSGGLTLTNAGTTTLSGLGNTYAGATSVQSGTLLLQETSGSAIPGTLTIGAATVRLNGNNQITASAAVTVNSSGVLDTNSHSNTIRSLTLSGGSITTGTGTLIVNGNITASGSSTISGNLGLGASTATFTVNSLGTLTVSAVVSGATVLSKAGSGTLVLSAANTYSGGTRLTAGTISVGNNSALGAGPLTLTSGTLGATGEAVSLANAVTLGGNVTIGGANNLTFTGTVTLTGNRTLTVSNTGLTTLAGAVGQSAGTWALTKAGTGTLALSGNNGYSGGTTITAGILLIDGTQASGTVTVKSGGTLGGTGTFGPLSVSSGGTVLPGNSPSSTGILNSGNVAFASGSSFDVALNGTTAGSGYDQLNVTGTISLGTSTLSVTLGFTPAIGASFTIIHNNGGSAIVGTFKNLAEGATFVQNGMTFQITYKGGAGHDVVITRIA